MIFEDSFLIHAEAPSVWAFLLDVNCLAAAMPGVQEIQQVDDRTFDGTISAAVGPIAGKFVFRAQIVESLPPSEMRAEVNGVDSVTRSTINADMRMTLEALAASGGTRMSYRATVKVKGRLAILGDMVLRTTAALIVDEFVRRLRLELEAPGVVADTPVA